MIHLNYPKNFFCILNLKVITNLKYYHASNFVIFLLLPSSVLATLLSFPPYFTGSSQIKKLKKKKKIFYTQPV